MDGNPLTDYYALPEEERMKIDPSKVPALKDFFALPDNERKIVADRMGITQSVQKKTEVGSGNGVSEPSTEQPATAPNTQDGDSPYGGVNRALQSIERRKQLLEKGASDIVVQNPTYYNPVHQKNISQRIASYVEDNLTNMVQGVKEGYYAHPTFPELGIMESWIKQSEEGKQNVAGAIGSFVKQSAQTTAKDFVSTAVKAYTDSNPLEQFRDMTIGTAKTALDAVITAGSVTPAGAAFVGGIDVLKAAGVPEKAINTVMSLASTAGQKMGILDENSPDWEKQLFSIADIGLLAAAGVGGKKAYEAIKDKTPFKDMSKEAQAELVKGFENVTPNDVQAAATHPESFDLARKEKEILDTHNDLQKINDDAKPVVGEKLNQLEGEKQQIEQQEVRGVLNKAHEQTLSDVKTNLEQEAQRTDVSDATKEALKSQAEQIKVPEMPESAKTDLAISESVKEQGIDFNKGKTSLEKWEESPFDFSTEEEADRYVAENSENPLEIVKTYLRSKDYESQLGHKEQVIADNLDKIKREDFIQFGDKNSITMTMAKKYFSKSGRRIDDLAIEMSDAAGVEITPQDIVDYITNEDTKRLTGGKETSVQQKLKQKFQELTGVKLTEKNIKLALENETSKPQQGLVEEQKVSVPESETPQGVGGEATGEKPSEASLEPETPKTEEIGITKEQLEPRKLQAGLEDVDKLFKGSSDEQAWNDVKQGIADGTIKPQERIADVLSGKKEVSDQDALIGLHEIARLDAERGEMNNQIREAQVKGDKLTELDLTLKRAALESEQRDVLKFTDFVTSTGGKLLRSAQFLTTEKFDFVSLKRDIEAEQGKPLTKEQEARYRKLSDEYEKLKQELSDLRESVSGEQQRAQKKSYTDRAKKVADDFRKLKTKPFKFTDSSGKVIEIHTSGITWNDAIEFGAKAIEASGKIADGVVAAIEKLKETEWYKNFSDADKEKFANELEQHYKENSVEGKKVARLEKQLEDLQQGKVKTGSIKTEDSPEAKRLKEEIQAEKEKMGLVAAKDLPKANLSVEEKTYNQRASRLKSLEEKLSSHDYTPTTKEKVQSARIRDINLKIKKVEDAVWADKQGIRNSQMGKVEKTIRTLTKFQRFNIFLNPFGQLRLVYAALFRPVLRPLTEISKYALSNLPVTKQIFEKSPVMYRPTLRSVGVATAKYYTTLIAKQTFKDALSEFKKRGNYSLLYEDRVPNDVITKADAVLAKPQQMHGFLKAFPKISAHESGYAVALENLSHQTNPKTGNPYDITNPEVQQLAMDDAMREAYADVFMNDAAMSKRINRLLTDMSASPDLVTQGAGLLLQQQLPVIKVPQNFYHEILQEVPAGGLLDAAQTVLRSGKKGEGYRGIKNLTPEQAHKAARALTNQAVGLMMVGAGIVLYKKYGDEIIKKIKEYKYWAHNTALPLITEGIDMAKSKEGAKALPKEVAKTVVEETNALPQVKAVRTTAEMSWAAARAAVGKENWDKASRKAQEMVASLLIPTGAAEIAKRMDDFKKRDPQTFKEVLEMRIPYLRELVGESGIFPDTINKTPVSKETIEKVPAEKTK